jgi:hypothetical protein
VQTLELLSGLALGFAGFCCVIYVLMHAATNEGYNKSVMWLLTGAGFVYYVLVEFDDRFKWAWVAGAVCGLGFGTKLFMMGSGINL